jgi:hypothetical protein
MGRAAAGRARLAGGGALRWAHGGWSVPDGREVAFSVR